MIPNPLALIAEITHRCPLHCVYCSNPLQLAARRRSFRLRIGLGFSSKRTSWEFCIFI